MIDIVQYSIFKGIVDSLCVAAGHDTVEARETHDKVRRRRRGWRAKQKQVVDGWAGGRTNG